MATVGKKKMKQIGQVTLIHEAIIESIGESDAEFLNNNPEMWNSEEKGMYDLLITHEYMLKKKIIEILESKTNNNT